MAPEQQIDARQVDTRADVYAFGVILYELLMGRHPLDSYRLPARFMGELTPAFNAIIERCLQTQPKERFPNFKALLEEFQPVAEALGVKETQPINPRASDLIHDQILSHPSIELRIRGDNFYKLGKFEDAITCYTQLLQEEPDRAYILSRRGLAYLGSGRYAEAGADFDRALALAPGEAEALLGKGDLCAKRGDLSQAFRYYDAAIQSDRRCWETVTQHKAVLLTQTGDYTAALECYDALLQWQRTANLLVSKAIVLEKMKRYSDALKLCEEALQIEPNSMRALALKAHLYDRLAQPREALATFLRLLLENPEFDRPWLLNRIGTCYGLLGDYSAALRYHMEAYQLAPDNASYLFNCAIDFEKQNRWMEAAQLYKSYVSANSTSAEAWYKLGKAYAEAGDFQAACESLKQCLCLEDHPNAQFLLDYLNWENRNKEES